MKLILLYGGPGTGKLTVAKELMQMTGFTLFHNHTILNALTEIFGYEHPTRRKLEKEFRLRIIEEAVQANINMIATGVIMKDNEDFYRKVIQTVEKGHGTCLLVHLTAAKEVITNRIGDNSRGALKKINTVEKLNAWTRQYPESFEKITFDNQMTVDTSNLSAEDAAEQIIEN